MHNKRFLMYLHTNPFPPKSGLHHRALEIIRGFRQLGYDVTFASSNLHEPSWGNGPWQADNLEWTDHLNVYRMRRWDYEYRIWLEKRQNGRLPILNTKAEATPGMRLWFAHLLQSLSPDVVMVNYVFMDRLLPARRPFKSIMETIDLYTLNRKMWLALENRLPEPPINVRDVKAAVLREDFFKELRLAPDPAEFNIYDRYDHTLAITSQEAEVIKQNTHRTNVMHIGMTQKPCIMENTYAGPALLPTGANPFNLQGALYFIKHVLPQVKHNTKDFTLQITGTCSYQVQPEEGVLLSGFVDNLQQVYQNSRFVVCPIYGGTGQQVKIIEAMAHGVPVVALRFAASRSSIVHGINGFIADTADEFATYVLMLWNDLDLCRRLGRAARETIAEQCTPVQLAQSLSVLLGTGKQ